MKKEKHFIIFFQAPLNYEIGSQEESERSDSANVESAYTEIGSNTVIGLNFNQLKKVKKVKKQQKN